MKTLAASLMLGSVAAKPGTGADLLNGAGQFQERGYTLQIHPKSKNPVKSDKWYKSDRQEVWPFQQLTIASEPKAEFPLPVTKTMKEEKAKREKMTKEEKKDLPAIKETEIKEIKYLSMKKNKKAKAYFDDGLWYHFAATQPKHISFTVSTETEDRETCDFRLTKLMDKDAREAQCEADKKALKKTTEDEQKAKKKGADRLLQGVLKSKKRSKQRKLKSCLETEIKWDGETESKFAKFKREKDNDIVFFRLGYLNYMKLNEKNMVKQFAKNMWYDIDLILNWKTQQIAIYVNREYVQKMNAKFFIHEKSKKKDKELELTANAISIYGLSPEGDSKFANLQVCEEICKGHDADIFKWQGGVATYALSTLAMGSALTLLW